MHDLTEPIHVLSMLSASLSLVSSPHWKIINTRIYSFQEPYISWFKPFTKQYSRLSIKCKQNDDKLLSPILSVCCRNLYWFLAPNSWVTGLQIHCRFTFTCTIHVKVCILLLELWFWQFVINSCCTLFRKTICALYDNLYGWLKSYDNMWKRKKYTNQRFIV